MKKILFLRKRNYLEGQTLVEFALISLQFLFIIFIILEFSFWFAERSMGNYAAFMAARSYQVYGNRAIPKLTSMSSSSGGLTEPIYKQAAKEVLKSGLFGLGGQVDDQTKVSIYVDTMFDRTTMIRPEYFPKYEEMVLKYGISVYYHDRSRCSDQQNFSTGLIRYERFGLLTINFPHNTKFPLSSALFNLINLDRHKVYSVYKLERGVVGECY